MPTHSTPLSESQHETAEQEAQRPHQASFIFRGWLRDLLKPSQQSEVIAYRFDHSPGIKDPIEALGVPHTEVEAIVVNGSSVTFDYQLQDADRVTVLPKFIDPGTDPGTTSIEAEPIEVEPSRAAALQALRPPLSQPTFVLDVHLGKLARLLRILGFDALYRNDYEDPQLVDIAEREARVLLTRDRRLLFHRRVIHGHFVRHCNPAEQVRDIIGHYQLGNNIKPFSRCSRCNGVVVAVDKQEILERLEPKTIIYYDTFFRCCECQQIYWYGSHMQGILSMLHDIGVNISGEQS